MAFAREKDMADLPIQGDDMRTEIVKQALESFGVTEDELAKADEGVVAMNAMGCDYGSPARVKGSRNICSSLIFHNSPVVVYRHCSIGQGRSVVLADCQDCPARRRCP